MGSVVRPDSDVRSVSNLWLKALQQLACFLHRVTKQDCTLWSPGKPMSLALSLQDVDNSPAHALELIQQIVRAGLGAGRWGCLRQRLQRGHCVEVWVEVQIGFHILRHRLCLLWYCADRALRLRSSSRPRRACVQNEPFDLVAPIFHADVWAQITTFEPVSLIVCAYVVARPCPSISRPRSYTISWSRWRTAISDTDRVCRLLVLIDLGAQIVHADVLDQIKPADLEAQIVLADFVVLIARYDLSGLIVLANSGSKQLFDHGLIVHGGVFEQKSNACISGLSSSSPMRSRDRIRRTQGTDRSRRPPMSTPRSWSGLRFRPHGTVVLADILVSIAQF